MFSNVIIEYLIDITVDSKCFGLLNSYGYIILCFGDYFLLDTRPNLLIFSVDSDTHKPARICQKISPQFDGISE